MRNAKTVMSLLTAGTVMCSFAAEEAKPAAKPAEAPKPAAKPAEPEIWAKLPDVVAQIGDKKITKQEVLKTLLAQMPDGKIPPMLIGQLDNAAPGIIRESSTSSCWKPRRKKPVSSPLRNRCRKL